MLILSLSFTTGMIQALAGFVNYFIIMMMNGFKPADIIGKRVEWDDRSKSNVVDSYGQEWVSRIEMKRNKRSSGSCKNLTTVARWNMRADCSYLAILVENRGFCS